MKKQSWLAAIILTAFAGAALAQPSLQTLVTNGLAEPYGVAVDKKNVHYVTDSAHNRILKYDPNTGAVTNFAGIFGGPGLSDGPGVFAQFFSPQGIVYARDGLVVADSGNHQIRYLDLDGNVTTLAGSVMGYKDGTGAEAQFNAPAGLAADPVGNIYVADLLNSRIRKIDRDNKVTTLPGTYFRPEAVAVDPTTGTIYVADSGNHSIKTINPDDTVGLLAGSNSRSISGSRDSVIASNALFHSPRGLLWVGGKTGLLISDTGNGLIRRAYFNANFGTFAVETYLHPSAGLSAPIGMAIDTVGNYPLADLGRHSLLGVQVTAPQAPVLDPEIGVVILTTNIFGQLRTALVPMVNATFNNSVPVAILSERGTDTFFTLNPDAEFPEDPTSRNTPQPYENGLLDWPFTLIDPAIDGSNVVIRAISTQDGRRASKIVTARFQFKAANPVINGKNPGGFTIDNATENADMWYTTDGSTPVEGGPAQLYVPGERLNVVNGTNNILFKVRAFKPGFAPSAEVTKLFLYTDLETSTIGVTRDFRAGTGATIVVPVDVKLATGDQLRSLQFRVEVDPVGDAPPISSEFRYLHISTNDFIQLPLVSESLPVETRYLTGTGTGVALSFISNTNLFPIPPDKAVGDLEVDDISTVALLAIPIPSDAKQGQKYKLTVKHPSGTSDGRQTAVDLTTFADRTITITNVAYLVGDSAVGDWYNAGDYGSGNLNNADVNNAFLAACGIYTPYPFSDVFDAMDAFPEDSPFAVGGDGQIRFLDWNIISDRSLRLSENNWSRAWSEGGVRVATGAVLTGAASRPAERLTNDGGRAWKRDGSISVGVVENAGAGQRVRLPVTLKLAPGQQVKGFQFRAMVLPVDGAPSLTERVTFVAHTSLPAPISVEEFVTRLPLNQTVGAWSLVQNAFSTPLAGSVTLGTIEFTVPASATQGHAYWVRFANVDGAPDLRTAYDFESFPGSVWIGTAARATSDQISDEWKLKFFGNLHHRLAGPKEDPDGDGVVNADEYRAGRSPTKLRLHALPRNTAAALRLRWFGELGRRYVVERSADLGKWTAVADRVAGAGDVQEVTDKASATTALFYRVREQK